MEGEYVCSVEKQNKIGFYRLHSIWKSDKLILHVAASSASWVGEISLEKLGEFSKDLPPFKSKPPEEYLASCRVALGEGPPDMVYAIENGSFVWKKVVDPDAGVKIKLGAIPVVNSNFNETIQNMLSATLKMNQGLKERLVMSESSKKETEAYVDKLFKELEDSRKAVDDMENELMSQFLAILNAKKKKISELEQELIITKAHAAQSKPKRKNPKKEVKVDPYSEDTDEDMPGPSTSFAGSNCIETSGDQNSVAQGVQNVPEIDMTVEETDSAQGTLTTPDVEKTTEASPSSNSNKHPEPRFHSDECRVTSSDSVLSNNITNQDITNNFDSTVSGQTLKKTPTKLVSNKPKDVLNFFFGDEDTPEPPKKSIVNSEGARSNKSYDIMSQFF